MTTTHSNQLHPARLRELLDPTIRQELDRLKGAARASSWVAGHRITVGRIRAGLEGAVDVTDRLREAYVALDRLEQTPVV